MKNLSKKLKDKLRKREDEGTLRSLSYFGDKIDFYSNDYLSLSSVPTSKGEQNFSGTGSRLISGNSVQAVECEFMLAAYFGFEEALVFNSGYDANLGFFSSVPQKGDTVLYDEDIHASIRDGIRLSLARSFSFKHNDIDDLERLIKKSEGDIYIAVESLYSMKGDCSPLKAIAQISERYGAFLVVDEAHAAGVLGKKGKGLVTDLGLDKMVFAMLVTFGKAYGAHGAAILGSRELKDYLVNFARSFIYTTALPPESYHRISTLLKLDDLLTRRIRLEQNIFLLRSLVPDLNVVSDERSPIQVFKTEKRSELIHLTDKILRNGLAVKPIFSPTVQPGNECLRISLHFHNTEVEIRKLAEILMSGHP